MRNLFILLALSVLVSCEKDSDDCKCKGEFAIFGQDNSFYVDGVDCETGQPFLDTQGGVDTFYLGCAD